MAKLISVKLTQEILDVMKDIRKLKHKYKDFDFRIIENHLGHACEGIHEFTLKLKNQDKC